MDTISGSSIRAATLSEAPVSTYWQFETVQGFFPEHPGYMRPRHASANSAEISGEMEARKSADFGHLGAEKQQFPAAAQELPHTLSGCRFLDVSVTQHQQIPSCFPAARPQN